MKRGTTMAVLLAVVTAGWLGAQTEPPAPEVVATFDGGQVTARDLAEAGGKELLKARRQLYHAQADAAREAAYRRILQARAEKEGVVPEELERREIDKLVAPPDAKRVDQLMKQYRSRLPKDDARARQMVEDALNRQAREQAKKALRDRWLGEAGFKLLLEPPRVPVAVSPQDPAEGPEEAPVLLVEFSDFQCPYCSRAATTVKRIRKRYGDLVRVVHKPFPITSHTRARAAAEAALCAADQGRYEAFHDWIFKHRNQLTDEQLSKEAEALGLDMKAFTSCYQSKAHQRYIQDSITQGRILGVTATPSFFINGRFLEGAQPKEAFETIIDEELERAGIQPPPPLPEEQPAKPPVAGKAGPEKTKPGPAKPAQGAGGGTP